MKIAFSVAAVLTLALAAPAAQASFVSVDSYHQPVAIVDVDQNTPLVNSLQSTPMTTAVGGNRDVTLSLISAGPYNDVSDGARARAGGTADSFAFSSDSGILASLTLAYGSTADLNLDLSNRDGLVLGFVNADLPLSFDVSFKSAGTPSSVETFNVAAGNSSVAVPFSSFTSLTSSDIDTITFAFHPLTAGDFTLIEPVGSHVPEPASLGLLGLGALALLRRRR